MPSDQPPESPATDRSFTEAVFWDPHASPQSVWSLVAMYPLVVLAVYRRSWKLGSGILLAVGVNLRVVSPPASDEAWATRVVLGERAWIEKGVLASPDGVGLVAVGGAVHLYTLRAAAKRKPVSTAVGAALSMALMFLFFERMVALYDAHGDQTGVADGL